MLLPLYLYPHSPELSAEEEEEVRTSMVRLVTAFGMTVAAFMFWETMDKVHVWIALRQDAKVPSQSPFPSFHVASIY